MVVTIYVLESLKNGILYVGMTQDIARRLEEHNAGKSKFTSSYTPWKLIYSETANGWAEARKMEKYFKSAAGKKYINESINKGSLPD